VVGAQTLASSSDGPAAVWPDYLCRGHGDFFTTITTAFNAKPLPPLPDGYSQFNGTVYSLEAKRGCDGWAVIDFRLNSISDQKVFDQVRILRQTPDYEAGRGMQWVDVTQLPPNDEPVPNFGLRSVSARDDHLGVYVIALYQADSRVLADLAATVTFTPSSVEAEKEVTFTVTVTNSGPSDASNVRLLAKPRIGNATGTILSSSASQGSCNVYFERLRCDLGGLANGKSAIVTYVGRLNSNPNPYFELGEGRATTWDTDIEIAATESDLAEDNNRVVTAVKVERGVNQYPIVKIKSPANEQSFVGPGDIPIEIEASDPDGTVSQVAVNESNHLLGYAVPVGVNRYKFVCHEAANGFHSISAIATDNQGWKSKSGDMNNLYVGPLVVSLSSPQGTELDGDSPIILEATISAPSSDLAKVEIVPFSQGAKAMELVSTASNASSYKYVLTNMRSGANEIYVVVTDSARIQSRSSLLLVNIHRRPSVVVDAYIGEDGIVANRAVRLTAYVYDRISKPRSVEFLVNGKFVGKNVFEREFIPEPTSYQSIEWTPPAAGTYTLKAIVTNEDGTKIESAPSSIKVRAIEPNP
jgi:hypothetical protein